MPKIFVWVNNLWQWVIAVFTAARDFLIDLPLIIYKKIISLFVWLLYQFDMGSVSIPDVFQSAINSMDPAVLYFLSRSGMSDALGIISAGYGIWVTRQIIKFIRG